MKKTCARCQMWIEPFDSEDFQWISVFPSDRGLSLICGDGYERGHVPEDDHSMHEHNGYDCDECDEEVAEQMRGSQGILG